MKKRLYTVCVDNYFPELTKYTFPNLSNFARAIGADFHIIDQRKYPEFPPTYEKLQVYELGRDCDWNILVDADSMINPNFIDPTLIVPPDHAGCYMQFDASLLFDSDEYFFRDGRKLGLATNFLAVPRACHDLWTPLEFDATVARTKTRRWFIIDEYCISRNLARYGLKYTGLIGDEDKTAFHHFDFNTSAPSKEAVVAQAKALHEHYLPQYLCEK